MKVGDKLICINDELNYSPFVKGCEYTIMYIKKSNEIINFDIVFFVEHPDYMIGAMYLNEIFATEQRCRKLKLEKINNYYE